LHTAKCLPIYSGFMPFSGYDAVSLTYHLDPLDLTSRARPKQSIERSSCRTAQIGQMITRGKETVKKHRRTNDLTENPRSVLARLSPVKC
jgi:hypothetical protein